MIMTNSDENWLMRVKWVRGKGIFIEAIILFLINIFMVLGFGYIIYENIEDISLLFKISSISAIDIIAILTSLLLALGFIYYIGYIIARRKREPNAGFSGGNLKEVIIPYGAILFLAIFLPILIVFLSNSGMSYIILYIVINIFLVLGFGYVNENITQRYEAKGLDRDKKDKVYFWEKYLKGKISNLL